MGLFDNSAKKVENEILLKLSQQEILDQILSDIFECNEKWITECQGYFDDCERVVRVQANSLQVLWYDLHIKKDALGQERRVEEVHGSLGYQFTDYGYMPLSGHIDKNGREDVDVGHVIYLWTKLIREELQSRFPQFVFNEIIEREEKSSFIYKVPAIKWKSWF